MLAALPAAPTNPLPHVLLAMATVLVAARGLGVLFTRLRQPPVMGEVLAGILLGPSLLGRVSPAAAGFLLPPTVAPYLGVLAQVGIVLYMFLVGLELDLGQVARRSRATLHIAAASIAAPFVLGTLLALLLFPHYGVPGGPELHFVLFCGVAMSITAFPVLARILTDRGAHRSELGALALGCAAVDDVAAWCLLALVAGLARSDATGGLTTTGLTLAYVAVMLLVVRPLVARFVRARESRERLDRTSLAWLLAALLGSALAAEAIGVHALFGAFLLGALVPAGSRVAHDLVERLEDFVVVLFLPAFFAFTGMRTEIGLLGAAGDWGACALLVAVACAGKFGGTFFAARAHGLSPRSATALGVLMNTRGLMELIVLNVGLDLGILSPTLFAMFVLMALVTTFATTPIVDELDRRGPLWRLGNGPGPG